MKTTICFTTPHTWSPLPWLIRKLTRSPVSHVALCVEVYGIKTMLHCTVGGVQLSLRDRFEASSKIVEEYAFKPDMTAGVAHAIEQHLGDHYDYVGLLGYAYLLLAWRWLHKKIKNPLASPTALVCSEFVLHVDHGGVLAEWQGLDPERTTAQDLLERCRSGPNFGRVT